MLVCCCQGSKYHLDCETDPRLVSSAFEVLRVWEASAQQKDGILGFL